MKKITLLSAFIIPLVSFAQVIIGNGKTNVTNASVSLEFGDTENKGIVLPYVKETEISGAVNGTLIMDPETREIKVLRNNTWVSLSGNANKTNAIDTTAQDDKTEVPQAKVSIGEPKGTNAILALEDTNKAMILPRVSEPHLNIPNPAPGMMVYDTKNKLLAVFNGTQWSFWKQQ